MSMLMASVNVFIDASYFCFYRFYALKQWWSRADNVPFVGSPISNAQFVDKFRKVFVDVLNKIPQKIGLKPNIIVSLYVGTDCRRQDIWRNEFFKQYKNNRKPKEDGIGDFIELMYNENLFAQATRYDHCTILHHPKLEADDCIALTVKKMLTMNSGDSFYIITGDKDYLQLLALSPNIHIYTCQFKPIKTNSKVSVENYLLLKILMGDKSDNIPPAFTKCGEAKAIKIINDSENLLRDYLERYGDENFRRNQLLVDFNFIPKHLADDFYDKIE